jgi:hypothetical protein
VGVDKVAPGNGAGGVEKNKKNILFPLDISKKQCILESSRLSGQPNKQRRGEKR